MKHMLGGLSHSSEISSPEHAPPHNVHSYILTGSLQKVQGLPLVNSLAALTLTNLMPS